jgi:hypothetical protein
MWAVAVVVGGELNDSLLQVPLVEDQHMIQAFSAQRAGEALGDGVGLRGAHRRTDLLQPQASCLAGELQPVDSVAIVDEILRRLSVVTSVGELLGGVPSVCPRREIGAVRAFFCAKSVATRSGAAI